MVYSILITVTPVDIEPIAYESSYYYHDLETALQCYENMMYIGKSEVNCGVNDYFHITLSCNDMVMEDYEYPIDF